VIEDEPAVQLFISAKLHKHGYGVLEADTAWIGLELARTFNPDRFDIILTALALLMRHVRCPAQLPSYWSSKTRSRSVPSCARLSVAPTAR
jgi:hypothetical protein